MVISHVSDGTVSIQAFLVDHGQLVIGGGTGSFLMFQVGEFPNRCF